MPDPGKGSTRRPASESSEFEENFDKIFGKKEASPGRRSYLWDAEKREFIERKPPAPLSADLRFEGTFVSPVSGEVISNKYKLNDHNKRHKVEQVLPGMRQDQAAQRADQYDRSFGKQAQKERINDVLRAVEKNS